MKNRPLPQSSSITPTGWACSALVGLSTGLIILAGCGGHTGVAGFTGSTATTTTGTTTGGGVVNNATLQIDWPARTRQLTSGLTSALSTSITLKAASPSGADVIMNIDRNSAPAAYTGTYALTQAISPSATMLTASFYSQPAEAGTLVGTATAKVSIAAGAVNLSQINVAGTITTVNIIGNEGTQFEIFTGQPAFQLSCTALDANSSVVPITPGSIAWSSNSATSLSITPDGILTPGAVGQGTVSAKVDGVQGNSGCFVVAPPTLEASPWPRYQGGIGGLGQGTHAISLASNFVEEFPTGQGSGIGSPVIGTAGAVYYGSQDGNLYKLSSALVPLGLLHLGTSINSTPAVAVNNAFDERVYVGCDDHCLYSVSANEMQVNWKYQSGGTIDDGINVGTDGTIYFAASDHVLYALNPWGTLKWKYQMGGGPNKLNLSSPSIGPDGTIYIGNVDNNLYAINTSGTLVWKFATGGPVESSPAVDGGGRTFFGSDDMNLYEVDSSGSLVWKVSLGTSLKANQSLTSSPAMYETPVFATATIASTDGNLYGVDQNGSVTFKYAVSTTHPLIGSPILDSNEDILVGSPDGNVYQISQAGALLNSITGIADIFAASPALGSQGVYFSGFSGGKVYDAL